MIYDICIIHSKRKKKKSAGANHHQYSLYMYADVYYDCNNRFEVKNERVSLMKHGKHCSRQYFESFRYSRTIQYFSNFDPGEVYVVCTHAFSLSEAAV